MPVIKLPDVFNFSVEENENEATIYLYGYIGEDYWIEEEKQNTAERFISEFPRLERKYDRINIRINSPGGSMYHGNAIVNAIVNSDKEIHTYNDGLAASMGFGIFMAAPNRHWGRASTGMSHKPSTVTWGNADDHMGSIDMLEAFETTLTEVLSSNLGITETEVSATFMTGKDKWITRKEAKSLGLITIDDKFDSKEETKDLSNLSHKKLMNRYNQKIAAHVAASIANEKYKTIQNSKNMLDTIKALIGLMTLKCGIDLSINEESETLQDDFMTALNEGLESATSLQDQIDSATKPLQDTIDSLNAEIATLKEGSGGDNPEDAMNIVKLQGQMVKMKSEKDAIIAAQAATINTYITGSTNTPHQAANNAHGNIGNAVKEISPTDVPVELEEAEDK